MRARAVVHVALTGHRTDTRFPLSHNKNDHNDRVSRSSAAPPQLHAVHFRSRADAVWVAVSAVLDGPMPKRNKDQLNPPRSAWITKLCQHTAAVRAEFGVSTSADPTRWCSNSLPDLVLVRGTTGGVWGAGGIKRAMRNEYHCV